MSNNFQWSGKPSQVINFLDFVFSFLAVIGITVVYSKGSHLFSYSGVVAIALSSAILARLAWIMLGVSMTRYIISDGKLIEQKGILNRKYESLELFRVKDVTALKPLLLRLFGLGHIRLDTSDKSSPVAYLAGIQQVETLLGELSQLVKAERRKHGVREFD